jgi:quercetin dioxygenase-like cupin family protein
MRTAFMMFGVACLVVSAAMAQGQGVDHTSATSGHGGASQVGPGHMHDGPPMKVEFENDSVQVIRIVVPPHAKIPMHEVDTARVVILLTDEDLRITAPDGTTKEIHQKAGEANWMTPQKHAGENLSDKPLEFVVVVPKKS